jgi:hypothetical protein
MSLLLALKTLGTGSTVFPSVYPYMLPLTVDRGLDQVRNIIEVTRAGGSTYKAKASPSTIDLQGSRRLTVTAQITSDVAAAGMAAWLLQVYGTPRKRVVELQVDVLADKTNLLPRVLGDEIGTRIQLTHTLNAGGSWTIVGLIDGISHKLTRSSWIVSYYLDVVLASAPAPSW